MPLLEKCYWSPKRVGGWILGPEDLLISFAVALMAWFIVALLLRGKISFASTTPGFFRRYNTAAGLSVGFFLVFHFSGLEPMASLILTCGVMAILLQIIRRDLWPLALCGFLGFPLLYLLVVRLDFWLCPDFILQWNRDSVWGVTFLGFPLGEITWSVVFGAYWPLFFSYTFMVEVAPSRKDARTCVAAA